MGEVNAAGQRGESGEEAVEVEGGIDPGKDAGSHPGKPQPEGATEKPAETAPAEEGADTRWNGVAPADGSPNTSPDTRWNG